MSFGDGLAQSIGKVGSTIIAIMSNGRAIVNSEVNKDIIQYISPINDSDSNFEKKTMVEDLSYNKTIINSETQHILRRTKQYNKFLTSKCEVSNIVTATVDQYYPSSAIMQATCLVNDSTDTTNYIIPYLIMDNSRIHSDTLHSLCYTQSIIMNKPKLTFCKNVELQKDNKQLLPFGIEAKTMVYDIDDNKAVINNAYTFVENYIPYKRNSTMVIQPATVNIEDYKPPNTTSSAFSGGGGLKGFRIVIQKNSYFEQYLSFSTGSVIDITALPSGMVFENGYLKGAPTMSGDFAINIKMDDNTCLSGLLIVTQVPREL